ncbi:A/G-specific adenine glycosylase [Clostridia bacterium]|nr:A/G-specific adenine glycosylase [Clostridia bacterium]
MAYYEKIAISLTKWYKLNQRNLPWRKTKDPYLIWISEIMAQQTRIAALIPYYERFIAQFPQVQILARAEIDEVLALWAGLGYYSRAHNLHKAAIKLVEEYKGVFPQDIKAIRSLPGIGEYTAGAIASISFGKPSPAVDGNVKRVYARLMLDQSEVASKDMKQHATIFVSKLMPHADPSILTQSLMELGALVCIPRNPNCLICPLADVCKAKKEHRQEELPIKQAAARKTTERKTLLLVHDMAGNVLLKKRKERLLYGMYQYVLLDGHCSEKECADELMTMGLKPKKTCVLKGYRHVFTHLIWDMVGYNFEVTGEMLDKEKDGYHFYSERERKSLAIPTAFVWLERNYKQRQLKHSK